MYTGFSRGDFGTVRSLELELRDAERASSSRSPRVATKPVTAVEIHRKGEEGSDGEAESEAMGLEARMTADVRNLMAAADENGEGGW